MYFLLAVGVPAPEVEFDAGFGVGIGAGNDGPLEPGEKEFALAIANGLGTLTPADRRAAEGFIETQPWILRPMLHALATDYAGLRRRTTQTMPRAFFLLVPALAGLLALFYRRRPFPDHLYFALHVQSFVFIAGLIVLLAQYSRVISIMAVAQGAAGVAILVHMVIAQRRVYGGGWPQHVWKALAVGTIYLSVFTIVSLAITLWVARASPAYP